MEPSPTEPSASSPTSSMESSFDVVIVGAGISGINTAYRVQTAGPKGTAYTILEARDALGGTWDLFKYPGIRSDSDLYTFGFPWRPWNQPKAIATGDAIKAYLAESANLFGIDKHIRYRHKVVAADWDSTTMRWRLNVEVPGEEKTKTFFARFLILGTGYYDYDQPLEAHIPGLDAFEGKVIHPQFWPTDYDYTDKRLAIIGSGATAVTLLPNVAEKAAHVTMVQRSPSYVLSLPINDKLTRLVHWVLPDSLAYRVDRIRFMLMAYAFFYFCRTFPRVGRNVLRFATSRQLPKEIPLDPHFDPAYNPWEQRLCICPNGDFYRTLRRGKADIVTGGIRTVTESAIEMDDGTTKIPVDAIVTATGLKISLAGKIRVTVDGVPFDVHEKFMWKGVMLQDLPNAAFVVGYTNASWTLGADATAQLLMRLLRTMDARGKKSPGGEKKLPAIVPRVQKSEKMESAPMLNLNSTYIRAAAGILPKTGNKGQWRPRSNYVWDILAAKWGDVETGLEYVMPMEVGEKAV